MFAPSPRRPYPGSERHQHQQHVSRGNCQHHQGFWLRGDTDRGDTPRFVPGLYSLLVTGTSKDSSHIFHTGRNAFKNVINCHSN